MTSYSITDCGTNKLLSVIVFLFFLVGEGGTIYGGGVICMEGGAIYRILWYINQMSKISTRHILCTANC